MGSWEEQITGEIKGYIQIVILTNFIGILTLEMSAVFPLLFWYRESSYGSDFGQTAETPVLEKIYFYEISLV